MVEPHLPIVLASADSLPAHQVNPLTYYIRISIPTSYVLLPTSRYILFDPLQMDRTLRIIS